MDPGVCTFLLFVDSKQIVCWAKYGGREELMGCLRVELRAAGYESFPAVAFAYLPGSTKENDNANDAIAKV